MNPHSRRKKFEKLCVKIRENNLRDPDKIWDNRWPRDRNKMIKILCVPDGVRKFADKLGIEPNTVSKRLKEFYDPPITVKDYNQDHQNVFSLLGEGIYEDMRGKRSVNMNVTVSPNYPFDFLEWDGAYMEIKTTHLLNINGKVRFDCPLFRKRYYNKPENMRPDYTTLFIFPKKLDNVKKDCLGFFMFRMRDCPIKATKLRWELYKEHILPVNLLKQKHIKGLALKPKLIIRLQKEAKGT